METFRKKYAYLSNPAPITTMSNGECYANDGTSRHTESVFVNGGETARDDDDWCGSFNVDSLLQDAPLDSIRQRTRVDREDSITDASELADDKDDVSQKVDLDFVDGQILMTVKVRSEGTVPLSSQSDVMYKKSSVIVTRTVTIDMTCTPNRRQLYSVLQRRRNDRGSLDSEQTSQLYRGFMELVEANEARKSTVKPTALVSSSTSRSRAELPNCQVANGDMATVRQRESLLSSWSTSSNSSAAVSPLTGNRLGSRITSEDVTSATSPAAVSPLTGNRLGSRSTSEDVTSAKVGKRTPLTSYNRPNGLTTESHIRGTSSSSSCSSGLKPLTTGSSLFNKFDTANDSLAGRVVNGGGTSGYGERSPDVATSSYLARSPIDDPSSPTARLQSLRDFYSPTSRNDSAASRPDHRPLSAGWGGVDGLTSSSGLSRLTSYDADPTMELLNGTPTSRRYEQVMSARSRSLVRRGDVTRDSGTTAARSRTSPVAATRLAMNDLSDVLLSSAVEQPAPPARSTPFVSSRAERMKSYAVGPSRRTDLYHKAADVTLTAVSPPTLITTDNSETRLYETTTLRSTQNDATSAMQTKSETSSLKSSNLVNGTEMPLKTEMSQIAAVDKSNIQQDTVVLPTANSSNTVIKNGITKLPEPSQSRLQSTTTSVHAGYQNTENGKLVASASTNGLKTTFEAKSTTSGASSSETDWSRKTDADDIAGSSLSAATLNRLQAAAAAAADAAVSVAARDRVEPMEGTLSASVEETSLSSPSSSKHRTTTTENRHNNDVSVNVAESLSTTPSCTTSRTKSRTPLTLQEMLIPSSGQKNVKSPPSVNQTNDSARSESGRQLNSVPSSSSSKAAHSVESASKPASVKSDGAVKSRSKMLVNVHEMLAPAPILSNNGGGKTETEPANVTSTSNITTTSTSRARTSSTSSTTEKKSGNATQTKPSSQPSRKQVPSSDAASRSGAMTADRSSTRRSTASSTVLRQTSSTPTSKTTQPVSERKLASKMTTATPKQTLEATSKTSMTVDEDDWKTALTDIIQSSAAAAADDTVVVAEHPIQLSPSISSLQSEPPSTSASNRQKKSGSVEGLSSLMRPTASSMARRGSTGDTGPAPGSARRPGYAAPTSSSASKAMSSTMSRTTSSPSLRAGGTLSIARNAAAAGTASGRTTPTSPRRTADTPALQTAARSARTTNPPSATARTPRPGTTTTTPGRTTTTTNSAQRGAAQNASRTTVSDRSRNNSTSSSSGNAVTGRK